MKPEKDTPPTVRLFNGHLRLNPAVPGGKQPGKILCESYIHQALSYLEHSAWESPKILTDLGCLQCAKIMLAYVAIQIKYKAWGSETT